MTEFHRQSRAIDIYYSTEFWSPVTEFAKKFLEPIGELPIININWKEEIVQTKHQKHIISGESGVDNFRIRSESEFYGYGEEFLISMRI
jgi:hypothetical protein